MTLKQVRQRLTELLRNGHPSAEERRQRFKVAGVPEVAFRWIVPTRSCLDGNQPALIFPSVFVSHALQRLLLIVSQCGQLLPMARNAPLDPCDRAASPDPRGRTTSLAPTATGARAKVAVRLYIGARRTVHNDRFRSHDGTGRRSGRPRLQGTPAHASARLWIHPRQQGPRHALG